MARRPLPPAATCSERAARSVSGAWDRYWSGTRENAAHREGGAQDAALDAFWSALFDSRRAPGRVVDLAAGNGAVLGRVLRQYPGCWSLALDASQSAGVQLLARYPKAAVVCADGARLPLADHSFDWVLSQFGIEYAGAAAFPAAAGLVAPNGIFAAVVHLAGGAIATECAANRAAARSLGDLELLSLGRKAFAARFALNAGRGSVPEFQAAERAFAPAVRGTEQLIAALGTDSSADLLRQIYRDIAYMYPRLKTHDEASVMTWFERMGHELDAYEARMASMNSAALSAAQLDQIDGALAQLGLVPQARQTLRMGATQTPGAWGCIWHRPQDL